MAALLDMSRRDCSTSDLALNIDEVEVHAVRPIRGKHPRDDVQSVEQEGSTCVVRLELSQVRRERPTPFCPATGPFASAWMRVIRNPRMAAPSGRAKLLPKKGVLLRLKAPLRSRISRVLALIETALRAWLAVQNPGASTASPPARDARACQLPG